MFVCMWRAFWWRYKLGLECHLLLIFLLNFGSAQVLVSQECRMQANVTDRLLGEW